MFFKKFNIRKMHLVIFSVAIRSFSLCIFLFSFSCLNSSKEKSRNGFCTKITFKKICVSGRWFLYSFIQSTLSSTISGSTLFI